MTQYDYKVVPAPARGVKAKGIKGAEARFANAVELQLNELAAEGWEYQRAETLPSEERSGIASSVTAYRSILIFRRPKPAQDDGFQPMPERFEAEAHIPADGEVDTAEPETVPEAPRGEGDVLRDRVAQLMEQGDTQAAERSDTSKDG
ncbi:DUF4177 domain-containing protein [Thalassovita sp.]|uniref:DUF4177 domain-containing protein n=1 Tax=Thalassovita sp. TaxID=1979401 RepID=UPI002AB18B42|nr:DUF4177 domain-containing protein [Thalassovita sp.]